MRESWLSSLVDLVLPAVCAGCGAERVPLRRGACAACVAVLERHRPGPARPQPPPAGLPPCRALGPYDGVLREILLSYKEHGRHGLARPLGILLATVVWSAAPAGPLVLVPVPSTAEATRRRHGDHLARLARHASRRLRSAGRPVRVVPALRALPRVDSAELDRAGRAAAAVASLRLRPAQARRLRRAAAGAEVIVLDDIVTTGATLAAVAARLADAAVPVRAAAVLAATELRTAAPRRTGVLP